MPVINRALWYDHLVDDDGTGQVGTLWQKSEVNGLISSIDAALQAPGYSTGPHAASHAAGGGDPVALDAAQLTTGVLADARLSANVALKNAQNAFTQLQVMPLLVITEPTIPRLLLNTSGQAVDARIFQILNQGPVLSIEAVNDAQTVARPGINLTRNGVVTAAGQPAARLRRSTNQSLPNGALVPVVFDLETFDVGAAHDPAVNPSRLTVPAGAGGLYLILGSVQYVSNTAGGRMAAIRVNAATAAATVFANPFIGDITALQVQALLQLVPDDYIELIAYQTSGAALDIDTQTVLSWAKLW